MYLDNWYDDVSKIWTLVQVPDVWNPNCLRTKLWKLKVWISDIYYSRAPKFEHSDFRQCRNRDVCWFGFQHVLISDAWDLKISNVFGLGSCVLNRTKNGSVHSMAWISDAQYHLKTELFCSDFTHCVDFGLFENIDIIDAPKSKRIRISALCCIVCVPSGNSLTMTSVYLHLIGICNRKRCLSFLSVVSFSGTKCETWQISVTGLETWGCGTLGRVRMTSSSTSSSIICVTSSFPFSFSSVF